MTLKYSIDDTILLDPVKKVSIRLKGVTYFDRQEHLKSLYEQRLNKEDKHLTLEKYYIGTTQTLCLFLNGLEIGTIPEEHLKMFYSTNYSYELSNIHIDMFKNEFEKEIYWAQLFVIFSPKAQYETRKEAAENSNSSKYISHNKEKNDKHLSQEKQPKSGLISVNKSTKANYTPQNTTTKSGCSEITTILGCNIMFFVFLILAIKENPLFLFGSALCALGVILFIKEIKEIIKSKEKTNNKLSANVNKVNFAGKQNKATQEEIKVINKFRTAEDTIRKEVLMILHLEPIPEKKKKNNTSYSKQEVSIILTFRKSPKAVRNKIIEKLGI